MSPEQRLLIVGSRNAHKAGELRTLLGAVPVELHSLADHPNAPEVVEDGDTFEANARKKAIELCAHLGHWVLADDSGLVVDALGGMPGVYSARYAGAHGDDRANNAKLLAELADVSLEDRTARFVCVLVLAGPHGVLYEGRGHCCGLIAEAPRGCSGFGYDPVFVVREYHRTLAELGPTVKNLISHRARALGRFRTALPVLLAEHPTDA